MKPVGISFVTASEFTDPHTVLQKLIFSYQHIQIICIAPALKCRLKSDCVLQG